MDRKSRGPGKQVQPWAKPRYTNSRFSEEETACWELRLRGYSLRRIAAELGISKSTVDLRIRAVGDEYHEDVVAMRDQYIQMELERLDTAQSVVVTILEANHLVVSEGHVVRLEGAPLLDPGPVLAAIREFRMLSESRRKLLGLDAPAKHQVVHSTSDLDAALRELADEVAARADGQQVPQEAPERSTT